jgi:anti-sigma factor ChrR (cupin superfamily)
MKLLPTCREVRERLTDYAEGGLSARERASMWVHLLLCSACATFYRGLRALPGVARFLLPPEEPPPAEAARALQGALARLGGHRH